MSINYDLSATDVALIFICYLINDDPKTNDWPQETVTVFP